VSPTIIPPRAGWTRFGRSSSLVALAALVVAVPIGLMAIGGVPFAHVGLSVVTRPFSSPRSHDPRLVTGWIAGGALVLAWLAWGWLMVCIAVEVRSWVTGRSPTRLPASRMTQSVAAFLVGTALAVSVVGRGGAVTGARTGTEMRAPAWVTDPTVRIEGLVPMADLVPRSESVRTGPVGPNLRSLAVLGPEALDPPTDGETARETADSPDSASADTTAHMGTDIGIGRDSGARVVSIGSRPGAPRWERSEVGTDPSPVVSVPRTHLVRARETLWSVAAEELGSSLRWQELAELNVGIRQADGGALDYQNWITPGWRLLLPPDVAPMAPMATDGVDGPAPDSGRSDTFASPVRDGTGEPGPVREDRSTLVPSPTQMPSREPSRPPSGPVAPPVIPVGGGVMGAGVIRVLDRMRRIQQRHRSDGMLIRLPGGAARRFEQRLRAGEGSSALAEVDDAIRLIIRSATGPGVDPPVVTGVRIHDEIIDIVLNDLHTVDDAALEGLSDRISVDRARGVVVVDRADGLTTSDRHSPSPDLRGLRAASVDRAPAPVLATVGRGPDGPVMVNLESLGSLVVHGNPASAEAVVRGLAVELATSYWSGQFAVNLVGFGSELERFEGVVSFSDIVPLVRQLVRRRITGAERLRSTGHSSFAHARLTEASGEWDPLVVICGPEVSESDLVELLDVAADTRLGMVVIAVGDRTEAQHSIRLAGGERSSSLELLGSVVFPQEVRPDELEEISDLLDTAANRQSVLSSEEPYVNLPIPLPHPDSGAVDLTDHLTKPVGTMVSADERRPPSGHHGSDGPELSGTSTMAAPIGGLGGGVEVEVAVIGPLEIHGAAREFTRAWAVELVVYLALHPRGATNEAWATALWPDRLMAPSTLHSTASVARRSLGRAADGSDHLPRSHGRLALSPTVGTDWHRFVALADSDRLEHWRGALDLVRGRPFEGLRSTDWPILEGIGPAIEAAIVDLSGRLAGAYLRVGEAHGAEWAARRGLVVSPYDERLYRMLMRAADVGGNPAGVDAVMAELIALVAEDIEPLDAVHPSTMDLYRQLSRRQRFSPDRR
jgi:DNA-binding SARP family transcriptional activator